MHPAFRNRGYLPHLEQPNSVYFVTFRLAGSLPKEVLAEWQAQATEEGSDDELTEKIQRYLDLGNGVCHLRNPQVARIVRDALLHFDGTRYRLLTWCIMPNHVHILCGLLQGYELKDLLHSIKSFTANKANALLHRKGRFWQREYYDHVVRDRREYGATMQYILNNPAAAGIGDWPWVGFDGDDADGAPPFEEAVLPRG
jgi:REP element-mobilizing transposase RayT